jgi:hypothetical protein
VTQAVAGQTTLPRHRDADPVEQQRAPAEAQPTDPYFDRKFVATDDAAFVLSAVESARQSALDASTAETALRNSALRDAAKMISRHNEETRARLESIAKRKGWRLPDHNPDRATSLPKAGQTRAAANFIVNQISFHENTVRAVRGAARRQSAMRTSSANCGASLPGFRKISISCCSSSSEYPVGRDPIAVVREWHACRYFPAPHCATSDGAVAGDAGGLLPMHRTATAQVHARFLHGAASGWLARRWYYTPRTRRAYSVRQISPGDRRLLAEFALGFGRTPADRELAGLRDLSDLLLGQLINAGSESCVGFAALESNAAGDRVIGATAFAPVDADRAVFGIAVGPLHIAKNRSATSCCRH